MNFNVQDNKLVNFGNQIGGLKWGRVFIETKEREVECIHDIRKPSRYPSLSSGEALYF